MENGLINQGNFLANPGGAPCNVLAGQAGQSGRIPADPHRSRHSGSSLNSSLRIEN